MTTVTIHKAKTELSKLIAQAERGEEVIIARGRTPVARLVPYAPEQPKRGFGSMKGRFGSTELLGAAAGGGAEAVGRRLAIAAAARHPCADLVACRRPALPAAAAAAIDQQRPQVFVSAASAWEIATKARIGKLPGAAAIALDRPGA